MPFIFPPYIPRYWEPVSDQLRGGVSSSTLTPADPTGHHGHAAIFRGNLDPSILGAAFASQRCCSHDTDGANDDGVWDLKEYDGLLITANEPDDAGATTIDKGDDHRPKKFTIVFKDANDTESGGLTYEYTFEPPKKKHFVAWDEFKPVKRGKEVDCDKKLDTEKVTSVSWMCRSFFKEQIGAFEVVVGELRAVKKKDDKDDEKEDIKEEVNTPAKGQTMDEKKAMAEVTVKEMDDVESMTEKRERNRGCCALM